MIKLTASLTLACAAALLLSFTACSKSSDNSTASKSTPSDASASKGGASIVGTWQDADGAETITYKKDGTFSEKLASGDVVTGTYSMTDSTHIKVKFEGAMAAMGEQTFPVTLNGDAMDVTGPSGTVQHYKRNK